LWVDIVNFYVDAIENKPSSPTAADDSAAKQADRAQRFA
jgi:hypothetical protein